jgi:acetyl-CoA synthetase
VTLHPGIAATDELRRELRATPASARRRRRAAGDRVRESLPKTRSGKIMRRLLKARELGLPEGDTSTLETDERRTDMTTDPRPTTRAIRGAASPT